MMHKRPETNTTHPPGQISNESPAVNFEKPLTGLMKEYEEYLQKSPQKALQDAYERGYESGYQTGLTKAVLTSHLCIDPTSEASR